IRDGLGTPLTAGDIAERRGGSRRTVMQYINQLVKEGWLEPRKFGIGTGYYLSPKIAVRDADRNSPAAASWKLGVLDRDNWTCQDCGETENLHCHHIKSWWDYPEDRF